MKNIITFLKFRKYFIINFMNQIDLCYKILKFQFLIIY